MTYDIIIYEPTKTNHSLRFILGTKGIKPLFVIGLNPSTADDRTPDPTMRRVYGNAIRNGWDSFVMLNLYPQRTPYPIELPRRMNKEIHLDNLSNITSLFEKYKGVSILCAWGGDILIRPYLKTCLTEIISVIQDKDIKWLKIGDLTKNRHPRHPSRGGYTELTEFDIMQYLATIK